MEKLYRTSYDRISNISASFTRYLYHEIDWNDRLIAILGARGAGKTTLMLQYIKLNCPIDASVVYLSLDNLYFTENNLSDVVDYFVLHGGKRLFLDEVHKYKNWSLEIKNIYDAYPELKIVFTGSSILELFKGQADLSRRISVYKLKGMSFREFLEYDKKIILPVFPFNDLIVNHIPIALELKSKMLPLPLFKEYLMFGIYPFYKENRKKYLERLQNIMIITLENDIPTYVSIDYNHIVKLKQLLYIISQSVPFKPNIVKLSERIGANRRTIMSYIDLLERSEIITKLFDNRKGDSALGKVEKLYLANTNLAYALSENKPDIGNIRETFFFHQVSSKFEVKAHEKADFIVDGRYVLEVGGRSKNFTQINNLIDSYLAIDEIEVGMGNRVPLWLFGFLY